MLEGVLDTSLLWEMWSERAIQKFTQETQKISRLFICEVQAFTEWKFETTEMNLEISYGEIKFSDMVKHELRVESFKARVEIQKWEFESNPRVTSSNPRVTSSNPRVQESLKT